ncbi:hypothetical protein AAVH_34418, partial [Aphelenchoides avenae]
IPTKDEIIAGSANEKATILYLSRLGIIQPLVCMRGHTDAKGNPRPMKLDKKGAGDTYRASCYPCVYAENRSVGRSSIRKNSWLEGTKLSFVTIVRFIYAWCQDCTSVDYCEDVLGMSPKVCSDWCGYLREVCAWRVCQVGEKQIGGPGMTVEVDETLFPRRNNHAARIPPGKWVFGGVCREDKTQSFAVCVPDRSAATLLPIVRRWIKPGTRIISDDRRAYKELASDSDYIWDWDVQKHDFGPPDDST